jgi:restriction system protein
MTQPAKGYYRVMLGRRSPRAAECPAGGFIGADFGIEQNLSRRLPDECRQFADSQ